MKSEISSGGSATLLLGGSIALRLGGSQSKIVDGCAMRGAWRVKFEGLI